MFYVDLAVTGLIFGCMYAMMAVGLTLVYGLLRILHIAHAAVFALANFVKYQPREIVVTVPPDKFLKKPQ